MSTMKVDTLQTVDGTPRYLSRAHAYALNATFHNVEGFSSISDTGTGESALTFTNAYHKAYYSIAGICEDSNGMGTTIQYRASTGFRIRTKVNSSAYDRNFGVIVME